MMIPENQYPNVEVHLTWMQDYQPDLLRQLYREGKLKEYVIEKVQAVYRQYFPKVQRGILDHYQADEFILEALAPSESLNREPVNPMPEEEFQKILQEITE